MEAAMAATTAVSKTDEGKPISMDVDAGEEAEEAGQTDPGQISTELLDMSDDELIAEQSNQGVHNTTATAGTTEMMKSAISAHQTTVSKEVGEGEYTPCDLFGRKNLNKSVEGEGDQACQAPTLTTAKEKIECHVPKNSSDPACQAQRLKRGKSQNQVYQERLKATLEKLAKKQEEDRCPAVSETYTAISNWRRNQFMTPTLTGGDLEKPVFVGSFHEGADGRTNLVRVVADFGRKTVTSCSFSPETLKCFCCIDPKPCAGEGSGGKRVVFVASCQCFPPFVKVKDGKGDCLKVVRVEDGSLAEIMHALRKVLGGARISQGSVVVLGSLSELGRIGLQSYAAQLNKVSSELKAGFGNAVEVVPFVPIPMSGCGPDKGCR
jgi:hypothetical protein